MEDSFDDSVTQWIEQLKRGDQEAVGQLWQRYFDRLIRLAGKKLGSSRKRIADEEDVAISVFDSLWRGASKGRFQELSDRDDLWRLLVAITIQKAVDHMRREGRQKRGSGKVRGHSIFGANRDEVPATFDQFLTQNPKEEIEAVLNESYERLLDRLRDDTLRSIAVARVEGYSNQEIADQMGISLRSVERKLKLIREEWSLEAKR